MHVFILSTVASKVLENVYLYNQNAFVPISFYVRNRSHESMKVDLFVIVKVRNPCSRSFKSTNQDDLYTVYIETNYISYKNCF
jgi:hypothetical protein